MTGLDSDPGSERVVLAPEVWVARSDLTFTFTRSRGPGGQSVNKVSTAAQLRVPLRALRGLNAAARQRLRGLAGDRLTQEDELLISADTHRSQLRNRQACLDRLAELVRQAFPEPKRRRPTRPSRAKVEERLAEKRRQAEKKQRRRGGRMGEEP